MGGREVRKMIGKNKKVRDKEERYKEQEIKNEGR